MGNSPTPPAANVPLPTSILVATTNRGKVAELRRMLAGLDVQVTDLTEYPAIPAVDETGRTFSANACLKASYYSFAHSAWTIADDSGLAVDALGGSPGVHSARWAALHEAGLGDEANNALLLRQLASTPPAQRGGRFICSLALSDPQGRIIITTTAWVHGRLLTEPRGRGGFGYDPLFFIESNGLTTAEMEPAQKNAISHRGQATRRMIALLQRWRPAAAKLPR